MAKDQKVQRPEANQKRVKPKWQRFLESGVVAALIMAVGGLLGSSITATTQSGAKTKEFQLTAYKEYLDQERESVLHTSELVDRCVSASDDLITLTGTDFDPSRYPGLESQRLAIRRNYNACAMQWRNESRRLSFAMSYYHQAQPGVVGAWGDVQRATTEYMECAQRWYVSHNLTPVETDGVCKAEKDNLTRQWDNLNARINAARHYAWQQWGSTERPADISDKVPVEILQ